MAKERRVPISEIIEGAELNQHTAFGIDMIKKSISQNGFGRSLLVDSKGRVIAGRGVLRALKELGIEEIIIVETEGDELVVHRRTDLSIEDEEAKALAIADNRTSELNLNYNLKEITQTFDGEAIERMEIKEMCAFFNNMKLASDAKREEDNNTNHTKGETPEQKKEEFLKSKERQLNFAFSFPDWQAIRKKIDAIMKTREDIKNTSELFKILIEQE